MAIIILAITSNTFAQDDAIYFDKQWIKCQEDQAAYSRTLEEQDSLIKVVDYYYKMGVQFIGYVKNTPDVIHELKNYGKFELGPIGVGTYFRKNGKRDSGVNFTPFDKHYGVQPEYLALLDSIDTISGNTKNLTFEISYFKSITVYGFVLNEYEHGIWVKRSLKTGKVLKMSRNYQGELDGLSKTYYRSGVLRGTYHYSNGYEHGERKKYNRKGILVQSRIYEHGTLKETWQYGKPKKVEN